MTGYQAIFENVPFGLPLRDAEDHALLDANNHYCKMLGYEEELLELGLDDLHVNEPPTQMRRLGSIFAKLPPKDHKLPNG